MSETEIPDQSAGSLAAQAFRSQQANDKSPVDELASTRPTEPKTTNIPHADNRKSDRKLVSGRVRVFGADIGERTGKMIDFSATGASVLMDDQLSQKKIFTLDCNVYHNGRHFLFQIEVMVMYATLISGKGFKMGLQFGPKCSETGRKAIADLQNSLGC